jgi:hypothetical protein
MPGAGAIGTAGQLDAAGRAAALLRALPLRLDPPAVPRQDPCERGWIAGLDECGALLEQIVGRDVARGTAFGQTWPCLLLEDGHGGDLVVAPGLPISVGRDEVQGPDGAYWIEATAAPGRAGPPAVVREAGGTARVLLELEAAAAGEGAGEGAADRQPASGRPVPTPELLWFGDGERYLVAGGRLEVEDLFARLVLPASSGLLERLLVRQRRIDPIALEGLAQAAAKTDQAPTIEVRRSLGLVGAAPWHDPIEMIRARAGVEAVETIDPLGPAGTGGETGLVRVRHQGARTIELLLTRAGSSWRADLHSGDWPITSIEMAADPLLDELVYRITLGPDVDPMTPGLRGRLAFDLTSDLVTLGRSG